MENIVAVPSYRVEEKASVSTGINQNGPLSGEYPEAPFTLYLQDNKVPYSAKYFGIDNYQYLSQDTRLDANKVVPQLEVIENYIREKIVDENYLDSTKTYREIIEDIKETMGINQYDPLDKQLSRIASFIEVNTPEKATKPIAEKPSKEIFNKRVDTLNKNINKRVDSHFKNLDRQFKRIDEALYKRVDNQLKSINKFQKVSKLISKYLK